VIRPVNGAPLPLPFSEVTSHGFVLTNDRLALFATQQPLLRAQVASRWDLLAVAGAMHLPVAVLGTDAAWERKWDLSRRWHERPESAWGLDDWWWRDKQAAQRA
jgi:hypothetical protein